jgi:orotidine-5'-phosphate decarboxylase
MTFTEKLTIVQQNTGSLLCVGLDIDPKKLPKPFQAKADGIHQFIRAIIEATSDLVCAYKINLAFFEALGEQGWSLLRSTRRLLPSNVIAIADGKRGDIGNTSERYAAALFDDLGFNAATVNPYMGFDSIEPFVRKSEFGIFVLALTSNPGSNDFQRKMIDGSPLFHHVINLFSKNDKNGNIGFVVGATHPDELKHVRTITPDAPLLIPGIGAQGGDLRTSVIDGSDRNGNLALINVSRAVLYASDGDDFAERARFAAKEYYDQITTFKKEKRPT